MKQITFGTPPIIKNAQISHLRGTIVDFLINYGCIAAKDYVSIDGNIIVVKAKCGNDDYTKAFALLQLILSSTKESPFYVAYVSNATFEIRDRLTSQNSIAETINYLNAHLNCTII